MASYRAVNGTLNAVKDYLEAQMPPQLDGVSAAAKVKILSSLDLKKDPVGHSVGIYLHRISVDPFGRNRFIPADQPNKLPRPEIPVNLHILIIGWSSASMAESALLAWAIQQLSTLQLGASELGATDPDDWGREDVVQMMPEEMTTEDLLRIWDALPHSYTLSAPYLIKTIRLAAEEPKESHKRVETLVFEAGENEA